MLGIAVSMLAAATIGPAKPVTAAQLEADPDRYAGHLVTLSGQMDSCAGFSCSLCPEEATRADPERNHCLALSFDQGRPASSDWGADLDAAYRYASVVLTARFDPSCWGRPNARGDVIVCTDRASVLLGARVERVTKRRTSHEGLIGTSHPLTPASTKIAVPLIAQATRQGWGYFGAQRWRAYTFDAPRLMAGALICRTRANLDDERGAWPDSVEAALLAPSTEDRFTCRGAKQVNGKWEISF